MRVTSTYQFDRKRILPIFLARKETCAELARRAGCNIATAARAVNGEKISAANVAKIADALSLNATDYLIDSV